MSLERVSVGDKGKVIPCWWTENRKGEGTNSAESGARNLKAESIRSGAESTGWCVKLKTVTEIRRSSARDTVIADSLSCTEFFIGLEASGNIQTEAWCGQLYVYVCVVDVFFLFSFLYEASRTVLHATMALDRGSRKARKERIAVIKAWQNEWSGQS